MLTMKQPQNTLKVAKNFVLVPLLAGGLMLGACSYGNKQEARMAEGRVANQVSQYFQAMKNYKRAADAETDKAKKQAYMVKYNDCTKNYYLKCAELCKLKRNFPAAITNYHTAEVYASTPQEKNQIHSMAAGIYADRADDQVRQAQQYEQKQPKQQTKPKYNTGRNGNKSH